MEPHPNLGLQFQKRNGEKRTACFEMIKLGVTNPTFSQLRNCILSTFSVNNNKGFELTVGTGCNAAIFPDVRIFFKDMAPGFRAFVWISKEDNDRIFRIVSLLKERREGGRILELIMHTKVIHKEYA